MGALRGLASHPAEVGGVEAPAAWEVRNEMAGWASPWPLHASTLRGVEGSPTSELCSLRMPSGRGRWSLSSHPRSACTPEQARPWDSVDCRLLPCPSWVRGHSRRWNLPGGFPSSGRLRDPGAIVPWQPDLSPDHPAGARPGRGHSEPSSVHVQQEVLQELRGCVHLKGPNWDNEHLRK